MDQTPQWYDVEAGGVLELHEHWTAGIGLELQLQFSSGGTQAAWFTDRGRLLRWVQVGRS
jgi:hypothetical protein